MATIAVFPGDGIGPEVTGEALKALNAAALKYGLSLKFEPLAIGGAALELYGVPVRDEDVAVAREADAALLGAVGGPRWDHVDPALRPERGLLKIRQALQLFANLRPVAAIPELASSSPLKPELLVGVDLLVVRELTGGIYFGKPSEQGEDDLGRYAIDTLRYRDSEIERVVRLAFDLAQGRRGKVSSVDKSNVLQSSRLWRAVAEEVHADYPEVALEHVLVDAMAMHLVRNPAAFDVIVTENMFGDILTDEASVIPGSIGVLPSASVSDKPGQQPGTRFGLYEPIHGSAPDIAGAGKANPAGAILSAAMMLRWSLGADEAADALTLATLGAIADGVRTVDIALPGVPPVTTAAFGDEVARRIAAA